MNFFIIAIIGIAVLATVERLTGTPSEPSDPPVLDPKFTDLQLKEKNVDLKKQNFFLRTLGQLKPYLPIIKEQTEKVLSNPNANIVAAIIMQESGGLKSAVGKSGEIGLMQVKPEAKQDVNNAFADSNYFDSELFNPQTNIKVGVRFLELTFRRMNFDTFETLRAYNCGIAGALGNKNCGVNYANEVLDKAVILSKFGLF